MGCMYQLSSTPGYQNQGLMFRADWLEELGMGAPVTIEENYDYMKATKETYGCTNACYMNDQFEEVVLIKSQNAVVYICGGSVVSEAGVLVHSIVNTDPVALHRSMDTRSMGSMYCWRMPALPEIFCTRIWREK